LLSLGACEVATRLLGLADQTTGTPNQYQFYRFDPVLGWSQTPDSMGILHRAEFANSIRVNHHGMRYREIARARRSGLARVAVLGDSFAWGLGVEEEDRFTEQVERQFDGKIELPNFSVSGYGLVQYSLMLDDVMSFKPDLVVVVFCLGNDLVDNVMWQRYGYYKPYAELDGDAGVRISGYPLPNVEKFGGMSADANVVARWFDQHSALYHRIALLTREKKLFDVGQRGLTALDDTGRDFYVEASDLGRDKQAAVTAAFEVNRRLLLAMSRQIEAKGAHLLLLAAPTKCEFGHCFQDLPEAPNLRVLHQLVSTAQSLNVPIVDTSATLTLADFWNNDGHWRPSGHRKIADALAQWLSANLRLGP
jgi:lysophospholipase L1-like esterase